MPAGARMIDAKVTVWVCYLPGFKGIIKADTAKLDTVNVNATRNAAAAT